MFTKPALYIFFLNALIFFFQGMTKSIYPPLLTPLREIFLIDNAQAGLLVTLVFMGYALARFPSGIVADKWGCTRTILIGSLAMALSFLAVGLSPGFYSMAFFTFILGMSSGIYVTAGYTFAVVIGSRSRAATATAAFESFGMLAGISSPFLVTFFVLYLDWPWIYLTLGLILLLVTIVFYSKRNVANYLEEEAFKTADENIKETNSAQDRAKAEKGISKLVQKIKAVFAIFQEPELKRFIIWSILVGGLGAITWTGVNAFIPTFLVEEKGYSFNLANSMFAIMPLAGLVTKLGVGWLADRFGNRPVLLGNLLLVILLITSLTLIELHWQLLLILILLGATCYNTNTIINSYVLRNMPQLYQGTGFGFFCTAYTIIYSCGPFLTGLYSVSLGLNWAFRLSAIGACLAVLLVLSYKKFTKSETRVINS